MIYIDTSAFLAVLDADDKNHPSAKKVWESLLTEEQPLSCSDYILVETIAIMQNRLGIEAVRSFHENIFPLLTISWSEEAVYLTGLSNVLIAARRKLSLVDCISFEIMRRHGIRTVFTFDKHFKEQGFDCIP